MLRYLQTVIKTVHEIYCRQREMRKCRKLKLKSLQYWSPPIAFLLYFCFVFIVVHSAPPSYVDEVFSFGFSIEVRAYSCANVFKTDN